MAGLREQLLSYYERELTYIRQMGAHFAENYPKLAGRLLLEPDRCEDPHVERLLEGFALLAARIHLKLDDDFPQISTSLLEILYPHFLRPVPSMSIAEFQLDLEQGKLTSGLNILRGTVLLSNRINGVPCKFQTGYDTVVWPIKVSDAVWRSAAEMGGVSSVAGATAALRLTLQCFSDVTFKTLDLTSLRFYLSGAGNIIHTLYELLFTNS